jgi:hypothetical protein
MGLGTDSHEPQNSVWFFGCCFEGQSTRQSGGRRWIQKTGHLLTGNFNTSQYSDSGLKVHFLTASSGLF